MTGQLLNAYGGLETELERQPIEVTSDAIDLAGISMAVAWNFTCLIIPGVVPVEDYPLLQELSAQAENLPEFSAAPYGDSTYCPKP